MKIEHIGIAVTALTNSNPLFNKLFNLKPYKEEFVESEGVKTSFYMLDNGKIELLEATKEDSAIYKFIQKKGQGIHHIAFEVEDIFAEIERMKAENIQVLIDPPKDGADNKLITFLHPRDTNGVLIEFCMDKSKLKK